MSSEGRKRRMFPLLYWLLLVGIATVFFYITWPSAESFWAKLTEPKNIPLTNDNRIIATKEREPGITLGGTYIHATPDKIIIWTTIKLVDKSGKETYLKRLGMDNFSILESYLGRTNSASILQITSSNVPVRAILVIDKSGSMNEPSGIGGSAKIDVIKNAAVFFVDQLTQSTDNYVAILPFSGDAVTSANFLNSQGGDVWSNKVEKDYLERSINRLRAGGNTPLWQAIDVALDQLAKINDASYKVVICLSDGMNTQRSKDFNSLLATVREKQIPVFTIGYGIQGKLNDRELIQLSQESGAGKELVGSFIQVPPGQWGSQLQSIGADLSNLYELYWEPTGAPPETPVNVEIKVSYELNGQRFEAKERRSYKLPGN